VALALIVTASPWPIGLDLSRPASAYIVKAINLTITSIFLLKAKNFLSLSLLSVSELVVASNAVLNSRGHAPI